MKARIYATALFAFLFDIVYSRPRFLEWRTSRRQQKTKMMVDDGMLWIRSGSLESEPWSHPKIDAESDFPTSEDKVEGMESLSLLHNTVMSRHCFDILLDFRRRSTLTGSDDEESLFLRKLVAKRSLEYLDHLCDTQSDAYSGPKPKLAHPRKLLHFLAPKIPAIKHSPNINLRIYSAQSDIDSGVAACVIGSLAHVSEIYDKERTRQAVKSGDYINHSSVATDLISDRRFEQLVECLLAGVNVKENAGSLAAKHGCWRRR